MDNLNKNLKMKSQLSINDMLKDQLVPVTTNNYATEDNKYRVVRENKKFLSTTIVK